MCARNFWMMQAYVHLPDIKWGRKFLGARNCRETDLSELFPTQFVPKVKSRWARVSREKVTPSKGGARGGLGLKREPDCQTGSLRAGRQEFSGLAADLFKIQRVPPGRLRVWLGGKDPRIQGIRSYTGRRGSGSWSWPMRWPYASKPSTT